VVVYFGKQVILSELMAKYNLSATAVDIMLSKGDLRIVEDLDKEVVNIKNVKDVERKINNDMGTILEDENRYVLAATQSRNGKLVYPEVEIDYPASKDAEEAKEYCLRRGLVADTCRERIDGGFTYVLTVCNISESELSALKNRRMASNAAHTIASVSGKVGDTLVGGADFAINSVAMPVGKIGIKAAVGVGTIAGKAIVTTGASLLTNTVKGVSNAARDLSHDRDIAEAKLELRAAGHAVKKFFGGSSVSGNGIRVINREVG